MKAVFVTKVGSGYDDVIEQHYHFPKQYLERVKQTVGDQIIYYEPRSDGGSLSYFATAFVTHITDDPQRDDHFYAHVNNFLPFDHEVHFSNDGIFETTFLNDDGTFRSGAQSNAVRLLPDEDFANIIQAAFLKNAPWPDQETDNNGFHEKQSEFERPIIEQLIKKPFRDAAFRRQVQTAYDRRCAVTGLRIINGFGRPEVEAAHIQPVKNNGPDSVRNGLALSRTVHWMFDKGFFSLRNDFSIIVSEKHMPVEARKMLVSDLNAIVPETIKLRPHAQFLEYHRDQIFKG